MSYFREKYMNNNLLSKLSKRISLEGNTMKSTLKNAVRPLALTTAAAVLALSLSSCQFLNNLPIPGINPDDTTDIVTPGGEDIDPALAQYSPLLRSVLTDADVNALLDAFDADYNSVPKSSYQPHPYAFLASKGHNVSKIKSGALDCHTYSYMPKNDPNSLYIMTYVEDEGNRMADDYYAQYCIKYTLTDQESSEYRMLFSDQYAQCYFINDAISKHKTAQVVSQSYITKEAHEAFKQSLPNTPGVTDYLGSKQLNLLMHSFDANADTFNLIVFSTSTNTISNMSSGKIAVLPFDLPVWVSLTEQNNVFKNPSKSGYQIDQDKIAEYESSIQSAYIFDTSYAMITLGNNILD